MAYKAVDYHLAGLHNTSNIIPSWWCVQAARDSKRQYRLLKCQWHFCNPSVLNNNVNNLDNIHSSKALHPIQIQIGLSTE